MRKCSETTDVPLSLLINMKLSGKRFRKLIEKYNCDDYVLRQIQNLVIKTMPEDDIVFENCFLRLVDHSKKSIFGSKKTRYFFVEFFVTYYLLGKGLMNNPLFEIDFRTAEEISGADYERQIASLPEDEILREAKRIINPEFRFKITEM
jgi:hypothetical protein